MREQATGNRQQATDEKRQSIEVYVEELVLHGFTPGDRYDIGAAVEHELMRLFTEQGAPPSFDRSHDISHVDGGAFTATTSQVETIGTQVAQVVYGGLSR